MCMSVVRLSSSGKQVQFILTDDVPAGTVFGFSRDILFMLDSKKTPFIVPSILPILWAPEKFPNSEVWATDDVQLQEYQRLVAARGLSAKTDAGSRKFLKEREEKKSYNSSVKVKF